MEKSPEAMRTISEVAGDLDVPQHVIRFWETRFHHIRPLKRAGGRRYYRPEDVQTLRAIKHLLYAEGYTIRGAQKLFKEQGLKPFLGGEDAARSAESIPMAAPAPVTAPAGPATAVGDRAHSGDRAAHSDDREFATYRAAMKRALVELDGAAKLLGAA